MTATRPTDVLIVGGGVIGLAIGWRALAAGLSVTIVDREASPAAATTRVAAGMIAPIGEAVPAEPGLLELSLASAVAYPDFVADLEGETGLSVGYRSTGSLLLARDGDEAAELDRDQAFRERLGRPVTRLTPAAARRLEPALAPSLRAALEIPDDHAVDPRALAAALVRAITRSGGELLLGREVSAVGISHATVHGVRLDDGETRGAEHVVIAAGPWSGQIGGIAEAAQIPLRPVKGQILTLADPAGPGAVERVLRMQGGRGPYLVPRADGRYILGASVEERGFDTTITAGAVFELLREASELVPGISEWTLEELNSGIRPGTADNLPVIGPSPLVENLHWATGHHRHGVLLTPITAELVVGALTGSPRPALAGPLTPARFVEAAPSVGMAS